MIKLNDWTINETLERTAIHYKLYALTHNLCPSSEPFTFSIKFSGEGYEFRNLRCMNCSKALDEDTREKLCFILDVS